MIGILKQKASQEYTCEIKGLGEVFEIISIELLRKSLKTKYGTGMLYLSSNYGHSQRGFQKEDLEAEIIKDGLNLIRSGYADAPPWNSNPNEEEVKGIAVNPLMVSFSKLLFYIWIPIFERFYRTRTRAHVTWAYGQK